jgi:hypothetical protein
MGTGGEGPTDGDSTASSRKPVRSLQYCRNQQLLYVYVTERAMIELFMRMWR